MSKAPIMPFYTDAYLADTHHLSTEAHGAYLLLLLHTWRQNGKPPPNNDKYLSSVTKVPIKRWKMRIRPEIECFFCHEDGFWRQKRLEVTWNQVMEKSNKAKHAALIRHNPPNQNKNHAAVASIGQQPSKIPDPDTIIQPSAALSIKSETPAMDALKPILNDVQYFLSGGKIASPAMAPTIRAAYGEITRQLQPIDEPSLTTALQRLWRHFPKRLSGADDAALKRDYLQFFAPFPTDLVIHTIEETIHARPYPTLPPIAELDAAIRPRLTTRQKQRERIERLLKQTEQKTL